MLVRKISIFFGILFVFVAISNVGNAKEYKHDNPAIYINGNISLPEVEWQLSSNNGSFEIQFQSDNGEILEKLRNLFSQRRYGQKPHYLLFSQRRKNIGCASGSSTYKVSTKPNTTGLHISNSDVDEIMKYCLEIDKSCKILRLKLHIYTDASNHCN